MLGDALVSCAPSKVPIMNRFFVLGIGTGVAVFAWAAFLYSYCSVQGPPTALLPLSRSPWALPSCQAERMGQTAPMCRCHRRIFLSLAGGLLASGKWAAAASADRASDEAAAF